MKIYTKTGDQGETGLFGGPRVAKDDIRVAAYGTVDELSSAIGVVQSQVSDEPTSKLLQFAQGDLFVIGAELATPNVENRTTSLSTGSIERLEDAIDRMESSLLPLKSFILPGGSTAAASAHMARSICRRAERCIVTLRREIELSEHVLPFLNRLSDTLFVVARYQNHLAGVRDIAWNPN